MDSIAAALKKAGMVTDQEVKRAEKEKSKESEQVEALLRSYFRLVEIFPPHLGKAMVTWMETNKRLIPGKVLLRWKGRLEAKGPGAVWREWRKWDKKQSEASSHELDRDT